MNISQYSINKKSEITNSSVIRRKLHQMRTGREAHKDKHNIKTQGDNKVPDNVVRENMGVDGNIVSILLLR